MNDASDFFVEQVKLGNMPLEVAFKQLCDSFKALATRHQSLEETLKSLSTFDNPYNDGRCWCPEVALGKGHDVRCTTIRKLLNISGPELIPFTLREKLEATFAKMKQDGEGLSWSQERALKKGLL